MWRSRRAWRMRPRVSPAVAAWSAESHSNRSRSCTRSQRSYADNGFISHAWHALAGGLKHAHVVTIFGYRAPISDVAAIAEFKGAWGTPDERQFEQSEMIGRPGADQRRPARDGTTSFTRTTTTSGMTISIPGLPSIRVAPARSICGNTFRRTSWTSIPVPRDLDLEQTVDWYAQLMEHETESEG